MTPETIDLLNWTPPDMKRDGKTFDPEKDYERLNRQQRLVFDAMRDGRWRTLRRIGDMTDQPEASISARLRDFRKLGLTVERRRVEGQSGLWEYSVKA